MKAQTPAQGILLTNDYGDAKSFKIECDCGSEDHGAHMWIEVNKDTEIREIEVNFYVTTWTPLWDGWGARLRAVYEILFKGVHKQEHNMLLKPQAALNLAKTIENTVQELTRK